MKYKKLRTTRGYTLVEMLIALGIGTLLMSQAIGMMIASRKAVYETQWLNQVQQEAQLFVDYVARDIRGAVELEATFNEFSASDQTLILKVPSIDVNQNVIDIDNLLDRIVYYHIEYDHTSYLVREVIPDSQSSRESQRRIFGELVQGNSFQGAFADEPNALGAHVIHYQFVDTRLFQGKIFRMPISGSVKLRNKA